ncbi:YdbL family protein [Sulfuriroseicoccus oceanibius]|uniref:YdbL family protein n=1 Tax=Sulfuriroseicoccus oceanibius TaxID=2707525 RepID=A0A6B3L4R7_9BACT|nr:YdbL family protein [Sulfuriroseicoccus oceanibius]QQL45688.1 YdbL family protein [Sulfuriroseicoccus oceanibius]
MKRSITTMLAVVAMTVAVAPSVRAENLGTVKSRMEQRLADVVSLKQRGAVGEDNRGYLSVRGQVSAAENALVQAENADRKMVYAAIAKKTNASVESVGAKRAAQVRKAAPKGTWVQKPDGKWVEVS